MQTLYKKTKGSEDIRERLLEHAEAAKADPIYEKAYLKTQPKPIFQDMPSVDDEEEEQEKEKEKEGKKKCKHCGLKFCTCA